MQQAMNATSDSGRRLDYLDAVRAFALLLGIVFHAGLSFLPVFIGWAVMDVSTSPLVGGFSLVSHSFRMELFFLIAGFFSSMTLHRDGLAVFIRTRALRIGVPLLLGWFLLRPLLVSGWIMGAEAMRGDVNIREGLISGFATLTSLPTGFLVGTHLWFLYYLLLVTTTVLAGRAIVSRVPWLRSMLERYGNTAARWLAESRSGFAAVVLLSIVCLWRMDGWGMGTPDKSLVPDLPILGVYLLCFLLGWVWQGHAGLMDRFSRLSASRWLFCGLATAGSLALSGYQVDTGHPRAEWLRFAFTLCYAGMMWTLVGLSLGLFRKYLDRERASVRYLADASYWLYLVHLPIVVWLQIAVSEWPIHWLAKWFFVSAATMLTGLLMYDLVVRSTVLGQLLNGRRKPRALKLRRRNSSAKAIAEPPG